MTDEEELEAEDSFVQPGELKSSRAVLSALRKAEDAFRDWQTTCDVIDQVYNREGYDAAGRALGLDGFSWQDSALDLFWASYEILKPAIYARPPQPVVAPLFKDNRPLFNVTAEALERCAVSTFQRTGINDVMLGLRDDLIFTSRAAPWVRYEDGDGKKRVCIVHKDRRDFLHEPARNWAAVGWAAGAEWLTRKDMRKRFRNTSGDAYKGASYTLHRGRDDNDHDLEKRAGTRKCKVWEVWHRADNKVYWVTDGVEVFLDEGRPHLDLTDFFPCPKPAYATLQRRSLIPSPDYERYAIHFDKISELTRRIYSLLDDVRMKGLIPAGGDVGDAVEELIRSDDDRLLIPVPSAALLAGGTTSFVVWLPLAELATAIQGLIEARGQLIQDFYQLSGISDIMRGATEAEETLGAQQLKTQYGSVRVRDKSAELQRVAADTVKIAAEIIAEKFSQDDILEMSLMEIPTKAAIAKRVREIEKAATEELEGLGKKAKEAAAQAQQGGQQVDPAQAESQFRQAQQQILSKYAPMLAEAEQEVPIEDVMKLLRDDRTRNFVFEIESSSTVLVDELQEKQSRNEFLERFSSASQALMGLTAMGETGARLAGAMLRFVLAPYFDRAPRTLESAIDAFIDAAPEMAANAAAAGGGEGEELVAAQKELAEAEKAKAAAAMASVQARAAQAEADNQRKYMELQTKSENDAKKAEQANQKLALELAKANDSNAKTAAEIDKLRADTYAVLVKAGVAKDQQALNEFKTVADVHARVADQSMQAETTATDQQFRERGEERADRQQEHTEVTSDRQQTFAERQAATEGDR